jgi:cellulose biosynthesis protein BcsQ
MTDQTPDDIFALYSRFELEGDNYRVFHRETKTTGQTAVASATPTSVPVRERQRTTSANTERPRPKLEEQIEQPSFIAPESVIVSHREPTPIRSEIDAGRASLNGLWRHLAHTRTVTVRGTPETLASDSISVTGVAGGVGTTTIVAVLTRLLAKTGRRCAIFDDTEDPTLPIYFGAQRLTDEQRRFSGLRSIFESRARIVNRRMFETNEPSDSSESFIERNFAAIAEDFDHLVFDRPARSFDSSGARVRIHVAIPDLSSLARIQKVHRDLDTADVRGCSFCVLNRFDPSIPLHKELLNWYRENFRNLIVIREASLVTEALAEATTVVDWIPDSPVAHDFLHLFASVTQSLGAQSESLPLCS